MKEFDAMIGYTAVKKELEQIADVLKNAVPYEKLGVSPPRGLMLHGKPGVGKTLMAEALVRASGRKCFVCRKDQPNGDFIKTIKSILSQVAYDEAGPMVVQELLFPERVTLVAIWGRREFIGGFSSHYDNPRIHPAHRINGNIVAALGGAAATEQVYGIQDCGARDDFSIAFSAVKKLVGDECMGGFHLYSWAEWDSEELKAQRERIVATEVEKAYRKAKKILTDNRHFLDAIAAELAEKKLLNALDVKRIKAGCRITPVSAGSL